MNALQCLQCPVCTLFLHAGMSLESHLETHPKEQVIKALVQLACSTKCPEVFVTPASTPSSTVQRNVMIVNSTQYYRHERRSLSPEYETNQQKLSGPPFNYSVRNLERSILPPPPYTTAIEENPSFSSTYSNFQQAEEEEEEEDLVNYEYPNENNINYVEEDEEIVEIHDEEKEKETIQTTDENSQVAAQYFEKENGDFILHESPTSLAEYTEKENGEFLLTEKVIEKAPSVLHFNDDQTDKNLFLVSNSSSKNTSGLKVLSDVPVRVSDMTSSTGTFIIEYQNENPGTPFKSVIRTATNETETSSFLNIESVESIKSLPTQTRPSTKFFLNKQPKKLIVKLKKPVQSTSEEIEPIEVENKPEEFLEEKAEEKSATADEKVRVKYHKRKNHLLENFRKDECLPVECEDKNEENPPVVQVQEEDEITVSEETKPETNLLQLLEMTTEEECVSDYIGPFTPLSSKFEIEENTENENSFKSEPEVQTTETISIEEIEEPKELEQSLVQGILSFGISSNQIKSENWSTKTEDETIKETQPIDTEAGPSNRIDYSFPNLFANEQFLYSPEERNRVSNILEFNQENDDGTNTWHRQSFSPQYVTQFENDRNSYMDLDACKTNNSVNCDQAASVDSLNIRTDEKMPAKGEISEQESNGDNGEGSWNNQVFHDSVHRYPSSYDLSVAKDGWYLFDHEQEHSQENNTTTHIMPKFPPINDQEDVKDVIMPAPILDIKPPSALAALPPTPRIRHFRCLDCPKVFLSLKEKRKHLIADHGYTKVGAKSSRLPKQQIVSSASNSIASTSTVTTSNLISIFEIKVDPQTDDKTDIKPVSMDPNYLENETVLSAVKTESAIVPVKKIKRTYICAVCKETFQSISTFDQHLAIHPAACHLCDRTFKHWSNINLHLKRHLGIKNHACRICNKRFLIRQKLLEHLRTHTGITPISCSECPLKFRRYSNLVQHKNRHHRNIKRELKDYVCHCGEVFHTKAKFNWHKEIHDQKPKGCPHCRERFIHTNSLQRHIRLTHPEKYNFKLSKTVNCPICSKLYLKSSIKIHINTHRVLTEYKCTICQKAFSTKWNLKQHRWIHACRSTKPFKCKIQTCTKAFVRETDFVTHMNAHKAIKPYICDYCGCQFSRKYNKLRHVREHESPKKHVCTICNKSFHRAYYLTEHLRIHSGERKFSCNICGKTSATKTNHNKHIKIHHARDPLTAEN